MWAPTRESRESPATCGSLDQTTSRKPSFLPEPPAGGCPWGEGNVFGLGANAPFSPSCCPHKQERWAADSERHPGLLETRRGTVAQPGHSLSSATSHVSRAPPLGAGWLLPPPALPPPIPPPPTHLLAFPLPPAAPTPTPDPRPRPAWAPLPWLLSLDSSSQGP